MQRAGPARLNVRGKLKNRDSNQGMAISGSGFGLSGSEPGHTIILPDLEPGFPGFFTRIALLSYEGCSCSKCTATFP